MKVLKHIDKGKNAFVIKKQANQGNAHANVSNLNINQSNFQSINL